MMSQKRALVIEGDCDLQRRMQEELNRLGFVYDIAKNKKEALRLLNSAYTCDVIVLNLTLPRCTGLEMAGEITKLKKKIPMLLYTSVRFDQYRQATKVGIRSVLKLPADSLQFQQALLGVF